MKKKIIGGIVLFVGSLFNACEFLNFIGIEKPIMWGSIIVLVLFPSMFYAKYREGKKGNY